LDLCVKCGHPMEEKSACQHVAHGNDWHDEPVKASVKSAVKGKNEFAVGSFAGDALTWDSVNSAIAKLTANQKSPYMAAGGTPPKPTFGKLQWKYEDLPDYFTEATGSLKTVEVGNVFVDVNGHMQQIVAIGKDASDGDSAVITTQPGVTTQPEPLPSVKLDFDSLPSWMDGKKIGDVLSGIAFEGKPARITDIVTHASHGVSYTVTLQPVSATWKTDPPYKAAAIATGASKITWGGGMVLKKTPLSFAKMGGGMDVTSASGCTSSEVQAILDKVKNSSTSYTDRYLEAMQKITFKDAAHKPKLSQLMVLSEILYDGDTEVYTTNAHTLFCDRAIKMGLLGIGDRYSIEVKALEAACELVRFGSKHEPRDLDLSELAPFIVATRYIDLEG
ncbi:hypothetical protein LCGC14_1831850, partial [marine sediment metagenome]